MGTFDPYHKWLGIPPEEQPPNHYRLLGINPLEDDPEVIQAAADQRMAHLRTYQTGKHASLSQKLLNEVAAARVCLLNSDKKAAYDESLRGALKRSALDAAPVQEDDAVDGRLADLFQAAEQDTSVGKSRVLPGRQGRTDAVLRAAATVAVLLVLGLAVWRFLPKAAETTPEGTTVVDQPPASPLVSKSKEPQQDGTPTALQPDSSAEVIGQPGLANAKVDRRLEEIAEIEHPIPKSSPRKPPPLAVAPFDADQARRHQQTWASYLGVPVEITNSIGMKLVLIPPGQFDMGSTQEEIVQLMNQAEERGKTGRWQINGLPQEGPRHQVEITRPFYLGVYEVAQAEYQQVMGANPSHFKASGGTAPVENVSWDNAVQFCNRLSGLPAEKLAGRTYQLPTEAQWEYACRAGTTTRYCFGQDASHLAEYAWFGEWRGTTHPVGQKKPNVWGLYDMHGNVYEWCQDWHDGGYYEHCPKQDPSGPATGVDRVIRGGSWFQDSLVCRSARRRGLDPGTVDNALGFRVLCSLDTPSTGSFRRRR